MLIQFKPTISELKSIQDVIKDSGGLWNEEKALSFIIEKHEDYLENHQGKLEDLREELTELKKELMQYKSIINSMEHVSISLASSNQYLIKHIQNLQEE